jgi:ribosomal protein S18 acetylase RimI-like enzyme
MSTRSRRSDGLRVVRLGRARAAEVVRARRLFDRPPDLRATRAYLGDPRNVFLLASQNSVPVGFLRGTALAQIGSRRPQMFLYEIGVDRRFRGRGAGRALVRALLRYCRDHGFEEVFVLTSPENRPAVRLYRSTGGRTETRADRMYVYRLTPRPRRARYRISAGARSSAS